MWGIVLDLNLRDLSFLQPKVLTECLYRAIAGDLTRRIDADSVLFACAAAESDNYVVNSKFLFKIYENEYSTSGNTLQRKIVEDMVKLAYGERLRPHISAMHQLMEKMFGRSPMQELSLKEFETLNVDLSILRTWVRSVLRCFLLRGGRTSRLYALERKHSSQLEAKEVMSTYRMSKQTCDDLRRRFLHLCALKANQPRTGGSSGDGEEDGAVMVMDLSMRAELRLGAWLRAVCSIAESDGDPQNSVAYLEETLATILFQSRVDAFKPKWRFVDFASFCAVFGGENRSLQAATVVDAYIKCALARYYGVDSRDRSTCGLPALTRRGSDLISSSSNDSHGGGHQPGSPHSPGGRSDVSSPFGHLSPAVSSTSLAATVAGAGGGAPAATGDESQTMEGHGVDAYVLSTLNLMVVTLACAHGSELSPELAGALARLNAAVEPEGYASDFGAFIAAHYQQLPGMRDLALTACCRFGFLPQSPLKEKEFVTELSLRYLQRSPQSSAHPYGPPGTEWCVLPKAWYETWRMFVGHQQFRQQAAEQEAAAGGTMVPAESSSTKSTGSGKFGAMRRAAPPPARPAAVDCHSILRRPVTGVGSGGHGVYGSAGGSRAGSSRRGQLLPNLVVGRDVEVVCPAVFDALTAWYGGGPTIVRSVVTSTGRSAHSPRANTGYGFRDGAPASELELYPLSINIHTCDNAGNLNTTPLCEGLLFSKTSTVQDITNYLCSTHTVEASRVRLWNYAQPGREHWREQHILSPELTLLRANIQDGQAILMEVSLLDGSWPRSLLHAYLDGEERTQQGVDGAGAIGAEVAAGGDLAVGGDEGLGVYLDEYTGAAAVRSPTTAAAGAELEKQRAEEPSLGVVLAGEGAGAAMVDAGVSVLTAAVGSVLGAPFPSGNTPAGPTDRKLPAKANGEGAVAPVPAPIPLYKRNSGLVGMDNLGNTCYMNSSLQALLHTEPLVEYFLSKAYLRHLNLQSAHGFKGRLATSFGRLAQEMWCTSSSSITPRWFKYDIAHLHEQFAGNEQHDAHELLAFLLDGLSEDLNLVCNKPYTEQPDSDGRADAVLADIWWANHLKRDRSVIQALFSGQFKSIMTCTTEGCGYSSARFEPFTFLSLPVPEEAERIIGVTVVPLLQQHTVYCEVRVPRAGTLQDIVNRVLELDLQGLSDPPVPRKATDAKSPRADSKKLRHKRSSGELNKLAGPRPAVYFQAGELVRNKIRTFNSMERRVDTVRETECLVLFQIRRPPGDLPADDREPSQPDSSGQQGIKGETVEVIAPSKDGTIGFDPEVFYRGRYNGSDKLVSETRILQPRNYVMICIFTCVVFRCVWRCASGECACMTPR
jgi:hypothetical protein